MIRLRPSTASVGLLAAIALAAPAAGSPTATCPGSFEGTVRHGPDAGYTLRGRMVISVESSGALTGTLARDDGTTVPISGSVTGKAIHLTFAVPQGTVSGNGDLVGDDFATCTGTATGSLHGPAVADTGSWGIIWGS